MWAYKIKLTFYYQFQILNFVHKEHKVKFLTLKFYYGKTDIEKIKATLKEDRILAMLNYHK